MRLLPVVFSLAAVFAASSCTQTETEEGPDYENMVMADEEEELVTDEERDRKVVVADLPDPRELIILESAVLSPEDPPTEPLVK